MTDRDPHHPIAETGAHGQPDPSARLTVGSRVVVRYRLVDSPEAGATDVIGRLVVRTDDVLVVDTKTDALAVPDATSSPPSTCRRGRRVPARAPAHLRRRPRLVVAQGWLAVDRRGLGTGCCGLGPRVHGRANSVLVVGDPSLPLDKAIDFVEKWYADRDRRRSSRSAARPASSSRTSRRAALSSGATRRRRPRRLDRVVIMTGLFAGSHP